MDDFFLIAEVVGFADDSGNLILRSFSDFPDRLNKLTTVFIDVFGAYREFIVEKCLSADNEIVIKFKNFDNADDAGFLIGKKIFVHEKDVVTLPEDTYFVHDLVGSSVFREEKFFGKLVNVISLESNDVYIIENTEGKEILVPALKEYIKYFYATEKKLVLTREFEYDDED